MAQFDFGTINPATKTGSQLASDLNNFRDAILSSHKGSTAPTYKTAGIMWLDDSATPVFELKIYDGTDWIILFSINISSNTFNLGAVAAGATRAALANIGQIQDGSFNYLGVTTGTNTLTITATPTITSYATGVMYIAKAGSTNNGPVTLNIDGIGAVAVQNRGVALGAGDITANNMIGLIYNGTTMQLVTPGLLAGSSIGDGLESSSGALRLKLDGTTIARSSSGVKVADNSIDLAHLAHKSANTLLGMGATGIPSVITAGDGIGIEGGVISNTSAGNFTAGDNIWMIDTSVTENLDGGTILHGSFGMVRDGIFTLEVTHALKGTSAGFRRGYVYVYINNVYEAAYTMQTGVVESGTYINYTTSTNVTASQGDDIKIYSYISGPYAGYLDHNISVVKFKAAEYPPAPVFVST